MKLSPPTDRAIRRLLLTDAVGKIHGESRGTYGYRRVAATLMGCSASTTPKEPTYPSTPPITFNTSPTNSTTGHAKHSNGRLPQRYSKSRYTHSKRPVLQRPIESGQFTSWAFTSNVRNYGLKLSLGTVGDCYDNAMIEAFWGRMQTELLNRKT